MYSRDCKRCGVQFEPSNRQGQSLCRACRAGDGKPLRQPEPVGGGFRDTGAIREVGDRMRAFKLAGTPFKAAWERAVGCARPHSVDRDALDATVDAWRRAYEGEADRTGIGRLAEDQGAG